jgi:hypothetical protein
MTDKLGLGWTYTLIGGVYVLLSPMLWLVVRWGPRWRRERAENEEKEKRDQGAGAEGV